MEFLSVGTKGERTAQVIATKGGLTKVDNDRIFQDSKNPNLEAQVNEWLSYIFLGIKISANIDNSLLRASIKVSNNYSKSVHAPNMGFGVSYVLVFRKDPCHSKIRYFGNHVLIQQHIARLQVSVNDFKPGVLMKI